MQETVPAWEKSLESILAKNEVKSPLKVILDIYHDSSDDLKILIEGWMLRKINIGYSLLDFFIEQDEIELLSRLVKKDISLLSKQDKQGNIPLHSAVRLSKHKAVEVLLREESEAIKQRRLAFNRIDQLQLYIVNDNHESPLAIAGTVGDKTRNYTIFNLLKTHEQRLLFQADKSRFATIPQELNWNYATDGAPKWVNVIDVAPTHDWIANPTGQIVEMRNGELSRFCSGFNIGGNYFLTAGHCVGGVCFRVDTAPSTTNFRISFNYQLPKCGDSKSTYMQENLYKIQRIVVNGRCVVADNPVDFAIFELEPGSEIFGKVNLTSEVPAVNKKMVLAHHPDGLPKKISEGVVTETSVSVEYGDENNPTEYQLNGGSGVNYSAHMAGGSSGAPVGEPASQKVFAINVAGDSDEKLQQNHYGLTIKGIAAQNPEAKSIFEKRGVTFFGSQPVPKKKDSKPAPQPANRATSMRNYQGYY